MNEHTPNKTSNSGPATRSGPAGRPAVEGLDRLSEGAHSGINAASEAAHPAIDRMASGAHKVVDNADQVAAQAADAISKASDKGEELIAASTGYMREHPMMTLGVAVAAGFILSRLMSSR